MKEFKVYLLEKLHKVDRKRYTLMAFHTWGE